ncbi:TPA: hypothetical protein ACH3X2_008338 [Trebouxia sp. C0005]
MLKNSCVRATLSCNARGIRLTSQVPHRFRRLTSYPQQDPQRAAQRLYQRHAYGISTIADSMPLQQNQQLDNGPNTSLLADDLQEQWHAKLNVHLCHIVIRPASNRSGGLPARSGDHVTNVQTAFHTCGRRLYSTGHMEAAVPSAQAGPFVSITRLPERHLKLRWFGIPKRSIPCHQTK